MRAVRRFSWLWVLAVIVSSAVSMVPSAAASGPRAGGRADVRDYVVTLRSGARADWSSSTNLAMARAGVLTRNPAFRPTRVYSVLPIVAVRGDARRLADLLADPDVVSVAPDRLNYRSLQESLPLINQPQAAAEGYIGEGTTVVVADSGVDYSNVAFGSCANAGDPGCSVIYATDLGIEDHKLDTPDRHGTNVAGIVLGVAPGTRIVALDVFNGRSAPDSTVFAALDWTLANQARYNIVAVNLSLGSSSYFVRQCSGDRQYTAAFSSLRDAGVLPVVAAGNDAIWEGEFKDGLNSPACVPGAISVGAVYDQKRTARDWGDCEDTPAADRIICWSQTASYLSLYAPGAFIEAAGVLQAGTSQATPHVAGAVAVLASANPSLGPDGIEEILTTTGPVLVDDRIDGREKHRLDLVAALAAAGGEPAERADVELQMVTTTPSIAEGGTMKVVAAVLNDGPSMATGITLTVPLPAGTAVDVWSRSCRGDATVTCKVGKVAAGGIKRIRLDLVTTGSEPVVVSGSIRSKTPDDVVDNDSSSVTATVDVACTIRGTDADDTLVGTPGADVICGLGGDDVIQGLGGDDRVHGGAGYDTVSFAKATQGVRVNLGKGTATGEGTDVLDSIEGVLGSAFADVVTGTQWDDTLDGGDGDDVLKGLAGADTILGGRGNDTIDGGAGEDACAQGVGEGRVVACESRARSRALGTASRSLTVWPRHPLP